jgi:DNA-binding beta-propeller fold protein YncE
VIAFMTKSGRILEYYDGQFQFVPTDDETWKTGVGLASYGRNLYILSPANNQIYKYSRARSKYSNASEYNQDADLTGAISMAVDGNVYVLKKGGEILKLFKGEKQDFQIQDMATDLSTATQIFTTTDQKKMYVLDAENRRVVILEKDVKDVNGGARYKGQIYFDELPDVQGFYVDKTEKKLYLLTKKAVYQADL